MFASDLFIDESLRNEKVIKYQLIKNVVKNMTGKRILEVGCGAGTIIRSLQKAYPTNYYYGCDKSVEAIDFAKLYHDDVTYNDVQYFYRIEDSLVEYDVIFLIDVLEHVENPCDFLRNISKYLKEDGLLIVHTPLERSGLYVFDCTRKIKSLFSEHTSFFNNSDILRMIKGCDFNIEKKYYHYHAISSFKDFLKYYILYLKHFDGSTTEIYTKDWTKNILKSKFSRYMISILDWLSYYETKLLHYFKFCASGMTIVVKKRNKCKFSIKEDEYDSSI